MSRQMYRRTTLGLALQDSLDQLIQSQKMTEEQAQQILLRFDQDMSAALAHRLGNRMTIRGNIGSYRLVESVWTLILNGVEFKDREQRHTIRADKVKIVACDGIQKQP